MRERIWGELGKTTARMDGTTIVKRVQTNVRLSKRSSVEYSLKRVEALALCRRVRCAYTFHVDCP